jgi:hypothetical protein
MQSLTQCLNLVRESYLRLDSASQLQSDENAVLQRSLTDCQLNLQHLESELIQTKK